jgi:hypothetical protein
VGKASRLVCCRQRTGRVWALRRSE